MELIIDKEIKKKRREERKNYLSESKGEYRSSNKKTVRHNNITYIVPEHKEVTNEIADEINESRLSTKNVQPNKQKVTYFPSQDKDSHMNKRDKMDTRWSVHQFLEDYSKTHTIFYCTFTFEMTKKSVAYSEYKDFFHKKRLKLDKALLSNSKQFNNRPILYLFPETSKANTPDHFHGFLLIHDSTLEKFNKLCVQLTVSEAVNALDGEIRDNYILKDFLLDANNNIVPKSLETQIRYANEKSLDSDGKSTKKSNLIIDNHKLYKISTDEDFKRTSFYSTKNFVFSKEDYILEAKNNPKKLNDINKKQSHNENAVN